MIRLPATLTLFTLVLIAAHPARARAQGFDHSAYDTVLARHVVEGGVDYAALKAERGVLDRYLQRLAAVTRDEFAAWPEPDRIAYLINAYNAYMLQIVIDHYPIDTGGFFQRLFHPDNSVRQIDGVFDGIEHRVAGADLTLDEIEHQRLRENYDEPRIHFALVCAAVSCPPLRAEAYRGGRLDVQLDDQARRFLNDTSANRFDVSEGRVRVSRIFDWYGEDFRGHAPEHGYRVSGNLRGVLAFAARYLPERVARFLERGEYDVEFFDYDWTLNDRTRAAASR